MEVETNCSLAFLDLLVIRTNNGKIKTDWFHKDTWSGRYLNFNSCLPFSYKKNTIKILTDNFMQLSDPEFHNKNFQLFNDLLKNHYSKKLIKDIIEKTLNEITNRTITN